MCANNTGLEAAAAAAKVEARGSSAQTQTLDAPLLEPAGKEGVYTETENTLLKLQKLALLCRLPS